jgi:hypothetical protein
MRTLACFGLLTLAACSGKDASVADLDASPSTPPTQDGSSGGPSDGGEGDAGPTPADASNDGANSATMCNVDFLLVANSSGSMTDKQTAYAASIKNIPSKLSALNDGKIDVRFAVTTSDVTTPANTGVFIKAATACEQPAINRLWLRAADPNLDAAFACRADVGTFGGGDEQGLRALSLATEAPQNKDFFRPGALFAYLMILDDGDESLEVPSTLVANTFSKLEAATPRRAGVIFAPSLVAALPACASRATTSSVEDFVVKETPARASRFDMCNAPYRFDDAFTAIAVQIDSRCRSRK